jgi:hypothetical protein
MPIVIEVLRVKETSKRRVFRGELGFSLYVCIRTQLIITEFA